MEMAIFSSSPTFEETEFRGPHGSFDGIFRILASHDSKSLFWITCMTLHTVPSSEACMSNLNTYLDSLQKTESDEPNFIDMQALSIFSSMTCSVTHGSLAELTLGSSRM
jgi:hypothetical protein